MGTFFRAEISAFGQSDAWFFEWHDIFQFMHLTVSKQYLERRPVCLHLVKPGLESAITLGPFDVLILREDLAIGLASIVGDECELVDTDQTLSSGERLFVINVLEVVQGGIEVAQLNSPTGSVIASNQPVVVESEAEGKEIVRVRSAPGRVLFGATIRDFLAANDSNGIIDWELATKRT